MRAAAFALTMALAGAAVADAVPRDELFEIDRPVGVGLDRAAARLAPLRSRRPVAALHLSGGSARGLAHLGVLQRLEEAGFRPDLIVTNSMGSVVGLLYAAGVPPDVIADALLTVEFGDLFTAKLPTGGGIADLRGLLALARELTGDPDIAELPTPVVAVCEDLVSMRRVLLAEGPLTRALQAAIAIPGLFEPVELDGRALIDGGIGSLVPLEPFVGMADAHIVSSAFYDKRLEPDDPFTAVTMAVNTAKTRPAVRDIKAFEPFVIRNDVEQFSYMDWHRLREVFARGYEACSQRLPELERWLAERGVPLAAPGSQELSRRSQELRARWAGIKRELAAGRRLRLDRGYAALQLHPLLLRLYRAPGRLDQHNYLALSWLYEGPAGGIRAGALSDAAQRHGALLGLQAAARCGLAASLRTIAYAAAVDGADATLYHVLSLQWPLPVTQRIALGPFAQAELLQDPGDARAASAAGVRARIDGGARAAAGLELAAFHEGEDAYGPLVEVHARRRIAGLLHLRVRALYRQSLSQAALQPSYNDFFRGNRRDALLGSYAVTNAELVLAPQGLALTAWEAAIVRKVEIALFCDALWDDPARLPGRVHPSVGVSLQAEAALGGLLPLSALLSLGCDAEEQDLVLTLNLGAPY